MGFEDIVKKIQENTEKKIQEIMLSLEEEKSKLVSDANKKLEEIKQTLEREIEKKIQAEKIRLSAIGNIELTKEVLAEKKKLVDKVFSIAYQKILNLPEAEYKQFIIQLILRNIQSGNEELFLPEDYYRKYGQELLNEINAELKHRSINSNLKIKSTATITSGFVIKSNLKELNATMEVIFAKVREELEPEINKILFKQ
ncbi:MAG: V-type ATP synthase subunit E family protein [Elusimicrobiota bacterium]|nr:V-type ATP synthase subunit E family protein [Elusimicrobiota bacterium]